jgi:hypothetical protein|eukprot:COSAG02_NODE_441_length_22281_cov_6.119556_8_plen_99_part_00
MASDPTGHVLLITQLSLILCHGSTQDFTSGHGLSQLRLDWILTVDLEIYFSKGTVAVALRLCQCISVRSGAAQIKQMMAGSNHAAHSTRSKRVKASCK